MCTEIVVVYQTIECLHVKVRAPHVGGGTVTRFVFCSLCVFAFADPVGIK